MSSEYISGRAAINLYGRKGAYTALFVKSVSSNVDPQTPTWGLYGLSRKEDAMDRVLKYAHYCDSGMTRGTRGVKISGETEISLWREAIANAGVLPESHQVKIRFMDKPTPFQLPIETLSRVNELAVAGFFSLTCSPILDWPNQVKCGYELTLDLSLPAHVDLIWDSTRDGQVEPRQYSSDTSLVRASDIFKGFVSSYEWPKFKKDPLAVVVKARKSDFSFLDYQLLKIQYEVHPGPRPDPYFYLDYLFVALEADKVVAASRSVMSWFCGDLLIQLETLNPGTAESAYRAFKALHRSTRVTAVDELGEVMMKKPESVPQWCAEKVESLFARAQGQLGSENLYKAHPDDRMKALVLADVLECQVADNHVRNENVQEGLFV